MRFRSCDAIQSSRAPFCFFLQTKEAQRQQFLPLITFSLLQNEKALLFGLEERETAVVTPD